MCKWYCMSEGSSTNLKCLHCGVSYCAACLHGEFEGMYVGYDSIYYNESVLTHAVANKWNYLKVKCRI